jgi:SAM-dependent methyltransferase
MDPATIAIYDAGARSYCEEWLTQPPPEDLQALWRAHLIPGARTVDVGSGSGRDADWLTRHGFPCEGVDASDGLIAEARRRFPGLGFRVARLPALEGIPDASYTNVICETVIMHLPVEDVGPAVASRRRVVAAGGVLFLSWRVGEVDTRDAAGRLYSAFPAAAVRKALAPLILRYDHEETSVSSGRRVHRIIACRATA